jgi:Astacin (Peptidase family M12A)
MSELIACTPRSLPRSKVVEAAQRALEINPANHPATGLMAHALGRGPMDRERAALVIGKRWPAGGVRLTVGFLDNPPADLRARLLLHMNAWGKSANVQFTESNSNPQVRIARLNSPPEMAGYWSYVGTDILGIPANEPTLNLQDFTMSTPESEFHRVVRHETGHTMGFPHEHMRRELVNKIDEAKAIAYFGSTQGWTPDEVRQQVLTPLEDTSLLGTAHADAHSIMCYQIPGSLTKDGKPIIGGKDIDKRDFAFAASVYPKNIT